LYDSWWTVTGTDRPTTDQPLWQTQTTNTRTGADTWRCKECHGWDYQGKDGAYLAQLAFYWLRHLCRPG
jgi:thiosulfate dehydrogenase